MGMKKTTSMAGSSTKVLSDRSIHTVERSIQAALDFLYRSQLAHGEFRTFASEHESMEGDSVFDSSPFVTSFVIYSLGFLQEARVDEMTARGLDFLQAEMDGRGVWRYWSSHNESHRVLPPDLDDTACISFVLKQHGRMPDNRQILLSNRDPEGRFHTWLAPRAQMAPALKNEIRRLSRADVLPFFSSSGTLDNIDPGVNANVVLYLGKCDETQGALAYLKRTVTEGQLPATSYYADLLAFYYLVSRAYQNGVETLQDTRSTVLQALSARKRKDGSFGNELLTALAICTCLNFHGPREELAEPVDWLVHAQDPSGWWRRHPMWLGPAPYYGSEELTTALCIEALGRYI